MTKEIKIGRKFILLLATLLLLAYTPAPLFGQGAISSKANDNYTFENLPLTNNRLIDNYFDEFSSYSNKKSSKNKNQPLRDNFGLNYIAFSIGPSAPLGKYSQGAINDTTFLSGPNDLDVPPSALLGLQLSLDGAFYFDQHFGISVMGGYSFHPFDTVPIDGYLGGGGYYLNQTNYTLGPTVTANAYNNFFFFAGPCIGTGNEDVFFEVRAMIGVYHLSAFKLNIQLPNDTGTSQVGELKYSAPASTQLGLLVGADIRYKLNPFIAIMFKTDFIFSSQYYPMTVNYYPAGANFAFKYNFLHQNGASQVTPSLGVAYILNTESPEPKGKSKPAKKDSQYYYQ